MQSHSFPFSSFHKFHSLRFKFQSVYFQFTSIVRFSQFRQVSLRSASLPATFDRVEHAEKGQQKCSCNYVQTCKRTTSNLKKKFESNCIFCNLMHRTATWNIRPMSRKSAHRRTRVLQKSRSLVSIAFHRIECDPIDRKLR